MPKTTNYGLNLPENDEFYDVDMVNENTEIIDDKLKENADAIAVTQDVLASEVASRELAINAVNAEIEREATNRESAISEVKEDIANQVLIFSDVSVAVDAWTEDATYTDYPYKADIPCEGVTADYKPDVTFDVPEAISGAYAPVASTGAGVVSIYASEIPADAITIPTISCVKAVGA